VHSRPAGRTAGEDGRCKEEEPYVHARKQGGNMDGHSPADGARGFASSFSAGTIMGEKGGDSRSKRRPWKGRWPTATTASLPRPGWLRRYGAPSLVQRRSGTGEPSSSGGLRPEAVGTPSHTQHSLACRWRKKMRGRRMTQKEHTKWSCLRL